MTSALRLRRCAAIVLVVGAGGAGASLGSAPAAAAFSLPNPLKLTCKVVGVVNPTAKKTCTGIQVGLAAFSAIRGLFGGSGGGGGSGSGSSSAPTTASAKAAAAAGLLAIGAWVVGGAAFAVHEVAKLLNHTTGPRLEATWFSSTYWRVAAIAAVLTLPFLFAAAVQALIRSDVTLLLRAVLGYLPLAMLAVAIAAPLTMLLLAASDQLANAVSSASGAAGIHFLHVTAGAIVALVALPRAPFIAFFVGLLIAAGALTLWIELLLRDAAVYVIVLMLPLVFASMVWPARRIWAVRAVEVLVALILSKFAIVAVLSLGGAAITNSQGIGLAGMIAGVVLLGMGVFAPWALLRLIPFAELAASAAGSLRREAQAPREELFKAGGRADAAERWAVRMAAMRPDSERGLAIGAEDPAASNGSGRADEAKGDPGAGPEPGQTDGDPTTDGPPVPEPTEPDLTAGSRANGHRIGPEGLTVPEPSLDGAPPGPDLLPVERNADLTTEVVLGLEGPVVPAPRRQPPRPTDGPPTEAANQPSDEPTGDDHDPTPRPQAPPEGRL